MDFILNGSAHGSVAAQLMQSNFDPQVMRPWIGDDGRSYIALNSGNTNEQGAPVYNASPLTNATATLRKDEWKAMDNAIVRVARQRLRVFNDLRAANSYTIPNGMAKTVLEYEDQSDMTGATVSMDGLARGQGDRPIYDLKTLPLPIIHKDFQFSARQVMTSRNGNTPLDTTSAEMAARKVAEEVEKITLGVNTGTTYGGGTVYGYTNFPNRLTASLTAPTGSNQETVFDEILAMRQQAYGANFFGPYVLYVSPAYDQYLDDDFKANSDRTLRERILAVGSFTDIRTADYLADTQILMVQQSAEVARAVVGMDMTVVQWETQGGMQINMKVMAILVPQMRADQLNQTGIVHGSV